MNSVSQIVLENSTPLIGDPWPGIYDAVNGWRGLIVHRFASAEAAISDTLLTLHKSRGGELIRLEHLIGQRCQQLADAISPGGPFSSVGAAAIEDLAAFRDELALRALLCHGTTRVALDQRGRWLLVLSLLSFQCGKVHREQRVIDKAEAQILQERISPLSQRLCSKLAAIRKKVEC